MQCALPCCSSDRTGFSQELADADGIIFGIPTRFGCMPAQLAAFFDATGGLWQKGALVGKPASIFFSGGTQGGGQETTALSTVPKVNAGPPRKGDLQLCTPTCLRAL